jgi:hypothetical protein
MPSIFTCGHIVGMSVMSDIAYVISSYDRAAQGVLEAPTLSGPLGAETDGSAPHRAAVSVAPPQQVSSEPDRWPSPGQPFKSPA